MAVTPNRRLLPRRNAQRKVMELRFPCPGLRLAVGVILNLIISTNPFLFIFLLRVTPSANRNSYRVATPYYIYTQGRGAAHLNPGLGKRNSITFPRRTRRAGDLRFRVAAACGLAALCRRGVHHPLLCPALPALLFATPLLLLASPAPPPASRRLSRSIAMPALRSAPSQLDAKSPPSSLGLR